MANPESNEEPKLTKLQHAFKALLGGLKLFLVILFVVAIVGILLTIAGVLSTSLFIVVIKVMMAINMAVMAGIFVVLTILAPKHCHHK